MSYFDGFDLRSLDNLELLASQVVEGFIIGLHRSPFHGFSVEFAEHRLYNPGDSTKNIDWKVYARSDKMFVKKYEEETNLRAQIIIDTSSSMYFPHDRDFHPINKLEFSSLAAASLCNLMKKQRDAFGLSLFDTDVNVHTKAKSSTKHYQLMLASLDKLIANNVTNKKTAVVESLHKIADMIHQRSLVIIFSDMWEYGHIDDVFKAMQHLKYNKHEVIFFHVLDHKLEIDMQFEDRPIEYVDMESGERIKVESQGVRDTYRMKSEQFRQDIRMRCLQNRIDYVEANIRDGFSPVLEQYLVKRKKMNV